MLNRYAPATLGPSSSACTTTSSEGRAGRLEEEVRKGWKFLRRAGHDRVDREPARGQAVLAEFADGPEIRGAEKGGPVVAAPIELALAGFLNAKAGEARATGQLVCGRIRRHVEIGVVVDDLASRSALDDMHPDRALEEPSEVEERRREAAGSVREQGEIGLEADASVLVVVDALEHLGGGDRSGPGKARPPLRPHAP
jgi:hypothetical protein